MITRRTRKQNGQEGKNWIRSVFVNMQENCGRPSVLVQGYPHWHVYTQTTHGWWWSRCKCTEKHSPIRQKGPSHPGLQQHLPVGVQCPFLQCLEQAVISSSGGSIWRWHSLGARGLEQLLKGGKYVSVRGTQVSRCMQMNTESRLSHGVREALVFAHNLLSCLRPSTGTLAILICPTEQQHTYHLAAGPCS